MPAYPLETLNTVTLAEQVGKTLLTVTVIPFNASEDEDKIFAGGIQGMKRGFGGSFDVLAEHLAKKR